MTIIRHTVSLETDTGGNAHDYAECPFGEFVQMALVQGGKPLDTGSTLSVVFDTGGANKTVFSSQINDTLWRGIFDTGGDSLYLAGEKMKVSVQGQHGTGDTGSDTGRQIDVSLYFKENRY